MDLVVSIHFDKSIQYCLFFVCFFLLKIFRFSIQFFLVSLFALSVVCELLRDFQNMHIFVH